MSNKTEDAGIKASGAVRVNKSITINRPAAELYAEWKNLEKLPLVMKHLREVKILDSKRSHWIAQGPADMKIEWDAEIIVDDPAYMISWRSLPEAEFQNQGAITFTVAPIGRGTRVNIDLVYNPPAGQIGKMAATLFGEEPSQEIEAGLRRFKALMETGEIPTVEGQPHGD